MDNVEIIMEDDGDAIDGDARAEEVIVNFSPPAPTERRNPQGFTLGVCRVCGGTASTPTSTYCGDHRTRQAPGTTEYLPPGTAPTAKRTRSTSSKGLPTSDEWNSKLFTKGIVMVTALIGSSLLRRYNVNDPNDEIGDALTATDDEARRIAKPMGRFMAGSSLNKKYGRRIIDNSDLVDAGFALYDWYDRVNTTLRGIQQGQQSRPLASVSPIRTTGGEDEQTVTTTGEPGSGGYADGEWPQFGTPFIP